MSLIDISNLTFSYEGSFDNIFEDVSFQIDTDWKTGFVGRNGRGKTTFLNLLMGKYEYKGTISSSVGFDYFPFEVTDTKKKAIEVVKEVVAPFARLEEGMKRTLAEGTEESLQEYGELLERYTALDGFMIDELIAKETSRLEVFPDVLQRPFGSLSFGERTKLLFAGLFLKKNRFLLIDEPTNHLDAQAREVVGRYLNSQKGFILVSHDRLFLDGCVDHILSINKTNIEIQKGNLSSWLANKERQDAFELAENERLKKDIRRLHEAVRRTADWSDKVEKTKKGVLPKGSSGVKLDKGYIGHKAAKMMKRSKGIEQRREEAVSEKSRLLKNMETKEDLFLHILPYPKSRMVLIKDLSLCYGEKTIIKDISFIVETGERIALSGRNGSGKTSLLRRIMGEDIPCNGICDAGANLKISYVPQDTSWLQGNLKDFANSEGIDESLFKAILRKLDFERVQFEKDMSDFSEGQKKKVLLAKSLSAPAHLFLWDEPLNFIDILSRMQIEELILRCEPTMIFVEHDRMFCDKVATKTIYL